MLIRRATVDDAAAISNLVLTASLDVKQQDFSDEGWALLEKTNSKNAVIERFSQPNYFALIGEKAGQLTGYIAMLEYEKIDHLFVYDEFRKQGVASQLWQEALVACKEKGKNYFWVKSSSYAVPAYASFGFVAKGPVETSNGISYQFMERNGDTSI